MDARNFNLLEKSTRECCSDSDVITGSTASSTHIGASTVHQGPPPSYESNTETMGNPSTRLLSRSHPRYSSIGVPVPANGQPVGTPDAEETEQTVIEGFTRGCKTFWNWYKNSAIEFRNSCFIHILHILFTYIPISGIIMGMLFSKECPQTSFLPIYITAAGFVGIAFMCLWIAMSCLERSGTPFTNLQKLALVLLLILLLLIGVAEMYLVGHLSPNFDVTAEDYCSETFYSFLIGKEIVTGVAFIIVALLYLPGSNLLNCCQNCPMPLPASAFFSGL